MKSPTFKQKALALNPKLFAKKDNQGKWVVRDHELVIATAYHASEAWAVAYHDLSANRLKAGDKVKMVNCLEAEKYQDQVWECRSDTFQTASNDYAVFLNGFSGYFYQDFLQKAG